MDTTLLGQAHFTPTYMQQATYNPPTHNTILYALIYLKKSSSPCFLIMRKLSFDLSFYLPSFEEKNLALFLI